MIELPRKPFVFPLVVWLSVLTLLTLFPFEFVAEDIGVRARGMLVEHDLVGRWLDVVLNVLLFLPLGALFHAKGPGDRLAPALVGAALVGVVSSSAVEAAQLFLPSRFPSVLDVASNVTGALAGAYLHREAGAAIGRLITRARRVPKHVVAGPLVGFAVFAVVVSAALESRTRLSNWDETYPLVIGNEETGDRPWRGRVFLLEVTDRFTPASLLRRFARGNAVDLPGSRLASFRFDGASPYEDRSGQLAALEWTDPAYASGPSGALIERAWLRSQDPPSSMVRRVLETGSFTLLVRCATADPRQTGPARIVSNSVDPFRRNLTIGQEGTGLVVRLRALHTGANGMAPEFIVPDVFSDDAVRDVLITYDGTRLRVALADSRRVRSFRLGPGSSAAVELFPSVTAVDLELHNLGYVALLFVFPGIVVGILGLSWRHVLAGSVSWVVAFTLLFEFVLGVVSGAPLDWRDVAADAAAGSLVLVATATMTLALIPAVSRSELQGHTEL